MMTRKSFQMFLLLGILCVQEIILSASDECACKVPANSRPDNSAKAETARWMVHYLDWGVLSTISTRLGDGDTSPIPFGNVYSYVDGMCNESTGVIYLYGTYMDQSFTDSKKNDIVALTLSEASISSVCADRDILSSCSLASNYGDPENPVCGRVTLTGKLVELDADSKEHDFAKNAFFERHPSMAGWPINHSWIIGKIEIQDIWLLDFYGGASIIDTKEYFAATPTPTTFNYGDNA